MKNWSWQKWVGKIIPWAIAAVAAFLKGVVEIDLPWWPVFVSAAMGLVQLILSLFPQKE